MKIEFFKHSLQKEDVQNAVDVLNSIFLTTGPVSSSFEEKFSNFTGLEHTVSLSSCTAALHLSLLALDVGPGDEVITTPMTFIATATSILHAGAVPVFVDVEDDTGLIDVSKIEKVITKRTKAIMPVHLYGAMVDMKALRQIAQKHNLKIIEDCAHCIEGERDGIKPGQLGDVACYSFYATKNLTCGEGGAASTNNADVAKKIRTLRLHGMSKDAAARYHGRYKHWDMISLGWKYNLDDIHAALLVGQISRLPDNLRMRKKISTCYDEGFSGIKNLTIPSRPGESAHHLYTIWVDKDRRDEILTLFHEHDIGVAVNYRAIHQLTFFQKEFSFLPDDYPIAYDIGKRTITLPLYPGLTKNEIDYVIDVTKSII